MLSTPLICCSMGVATDCSSACASAPTYVAGSCISGGTIFGNCATGRLAIATAPTITVRIAITIATIGRLMKNFDISVALHERFRVDLHIGTNLLDGLGHHTPARLQS